MNGYLGSTVLFAGSFAPKSWAFCNGQLLAIASNTALFSILGTNYGGNGTTTFGLPDLRGRNVVGTGQGPGLSDYVIGEMGGQNSQTLLGVNLPAHNHPLNGTLVPNAGGTPTSPTPTGSIYATAATTIYNFVAGAFMAPFDAALQTSITGNNFPITNQQPVLGLNYIICTQGLFPARN